MAQEAYPPYLRESHQSYTSFSAQIPSQDLESTEFSLLSRPLDLDPDEPQFFPIPQSRALTKPASLSLVPVQARADVRPSFPLHGNPQPKPPEISHYSYFLEDIASRIEDRSRPIADIVELVGDGIVFATSCVVITSAFLGSEVAKTKPGRRIGKDIVQFAQRFSIKS